MRRVLVLLLALASAVTTAVYVRGWIERRDRAPAVAAAPEPTPRREVLLTTRALAPGTLLRADDLAWRPWPEEAVVEGFWVDREIAVEELVGAVVRRALPAGVPLVRDDVVRPGERGFLAAVLRPGHVGLTVPVDDAFAEAGVVYPGDRVDVLLTQAVKDGGGAEAAVETLVRDVRVVAIGGRLRPAGAGDGGLPRQRRTATLELAPRDAQRLALAMDLGRVVLVLRALARADRDRSATAGAAGPLWATDVSRARRRGRTIAVYRGREAELAPVGPAVAGPAVPAAGAETPAPEGAGGGP